MAKNSKANAVENVGTAYDAESEKFDAVEVADTVDAPVKKTRKSGTDVTDYTVVIKFELSYRRDIKIAAIMVDVSPSELIRIAVDEYLAANPVPVIASKN